MALDLVSDYIAQARVLLQDVIVPKRYTDATLINGLNNAVTEMVRLRPDLVFKQMRTMSFPPYTGLTDPVLVDLRFRTVVLNYIVGFAQLQDMEDTTDARGAAFLQAFTAKLMTLQA